MVTDRPDPILTTVLLLSQMRKPRGRKIGVLAQDHRAMQQWGPGLQARSLAPQPTPKPLLKPKTWLKHGRTFYSSLQILHMITILQMYHGFHTHNCAHAAFFARLPSSLIW